MLKVAYTLPEDIADVTKYSHPGFKITLKYNMRNSYSNIVDRGSSVLNTCALEIDPDGKDLVLKPEESIRKSFESLKKKEWYGNLTGDSLANWRFTESTITYNPVTITQSGIVKEVAAEHDGSYRDRTDAHLGNSYSYRLGYATSSNTRTDQLVFYDVLENGDGKEASNWRGTLDWVDLTSIQEKPAYGHPGDTANPVLYYATQVPENFDVDDGSIWSKVRPADSSKIRAIAVDCRKTKNGEDFILDQGMGLNLFVYMKAPTDPALDQKTAVNQTIACARNFAGDAAAEGAPVKWYEAGAKITLHAPDLELTKVSDPESGTKEAPAEIVNEKGATIGYTVTVTNRNDLLDLAEVKLQDDLPEGLLLNPEEVLVSSVALKLDRKPLREVDGMGLNQKGRKLEFLLTSLPKNASISFFIPVSLEKEQIRTSVFANTAKVTEVEGVPAELESDTTWHKVTRTYKLTYVVQEDPVYGKPSDSVTPDEVLGIEYDTNQKLAGKLTSSEQTLSDGTKGIWTFRGWSATSDCKKEITEQNIQKDETVYGVWKFIPTRAVTVQKDWTDWDNKKLDAPVQSVEVELLRDGNFLKKAELSVGNEWKFTFTNLPKTDPKTEKEYVYSVREPGLDSKDQIHFADAWYTAKVTGSAENGFTITNQKVLSWTPIVPATRKLQVSKAWEGLSEENAAMETVRVQLLKNGEPTDQILTLNADNHFTATFENLKDTDKIDGISPKNTYSVRELQDDGKIVEEGQTLTIGTRDYSVHYEEMPDKSIRIVNTLVNPKRVISGEKIWKDANNQDGKRPESVTMHLLADGKEVETLTVREGEDAAWRFAFPEVPTYDAEGNWITWTVTEDPVPDYETEIQQTPDGSDAAEADGAKWTVVNTHEPERIDIPAQKLWVDGKNAKNQRPQSVQIRLFANGKPMEEFVLKEGPDGHWTHNFLNLPRYEGGKEIEYTLAEVECKGYTSEIRGNAAKGFEVINTEIPEPKITKEVSEKTTPKTGDQGPATPLTILAGSAALLLLSLFPRKKERNRGRRR